MLKNLSERSQLTRIGRVRKPTLHTEETALFSPPIVKSSSPNSAISGPQDRGAGAPQDELDRTARHRSLIDIYKVHIQSQGTSRPSMKASSPVALNFVCWLQHLEYLKTSREK